MSATVTSRPRSDRARPRTGRMVIALGTVLIGVAGVLVWVSQRGSTSPQSIGHRPTTAASASAAADDTARGRDALAAAPMMSLEPAAALPHPLVASAPTDPMALPKAASSVAGVDAGFERTAVGAVAQLAAIDTAALQGMNLAQVANVYNAFAAPGADPVEAWSAHRFVSLTLASAGIPDGSSRIAATYSVSEAQVKGVLDNGSFVLACVNGEMDIWLDDQLTQVGAADCARMVWSGDGWRIGDGSQPAEPPNAWPGTADAARAGWRPITRAR